MWTKKLECSSGKGSADDDYGSSRTEQSKENRHQHGANSSDAGSNDSRAEERRQCRQQWKQKLPSPSGSVFSNDGSDRNGVLVQHHQWQGRLDDASNAVAGDLDMTMGGSRSSSGVPLRSDGGSAGKLDRFPDPSGYFALRSQSSGGRVIQSHATADPAGLTPELIPSLVYNIDEVPLDEDGNPTSIGSVGHYEGQCQRACSFAFDKLGCRNGSSCNFCHFRHDESKRKSQPCKAQRQRHRKFQEQLKKQVEDEPDLELEQLAMPLCINNNTSVKRKTLMMLQAHKESLATSGASSVAEQSIAKCSGDALRTAML
jgi:hypothetical protein